MTEYRYLLGVNALTHRLGDPGWCVVDCRFDLLQPEKGKQQYLGGHIPGAVYADLNVDLAGPITDTSGRHPLPDPDVFAATLGRWGIGNDTQVVVYDQSSGAIAARLWWMLRWMGHERVAVLDGGIDAWRRAGLQVAQEPTKRPPTGFKGKPNSNMIIETSELAALLSSGSITRLVDARDPVRFAGEREPIDAVAGHIPGAMNYPFNESIDADGGWKDISELRLRWAEVLGDATDEEPWIAMCGSGVTACHLALAAGLAGRREPRLYVGSWSEWIRDSGRPVAGINAADH